MVAAISWLTTTQTQTGIKFCERSSVKMSHYLTKESSLVRGSQYEKEGGVDDDLTEVVGAANQLEQSSLGY